MGKLPNLEIKKKMQGYIMKKKMYIFIISLFTLGIMGCGETGNSSSEQGSESKGTIGVSVLTLGNPFLM